MIILYFFITKVLTLEDVNLEGLGADGDVAHGSIEVGLDGNDCLGVVERVLGIEVIAMQGDDFGSGELSSLLLVEQIQMDGGRGVGDIGNLHNDGACNFIDHSAGKEPVLLFLSGNRFSLHRERQHACALVVAVELLDIIADGAEGTEVVEPDEVGTPLPALDMGKERSIGGHVDNVGIAFDAREEGSFVE